jgi:hypothetical protein
MDTQKFYQSLSASEDATVRFQLPTGELIPAHFHVTEVGRIDRNFIDCGGTRRHAASCLLQTWTAEDFEHRLSAGKLAKILQLAAPILGPFDLPVEVEYGVEVAAQYTVAAAHTEPGAITFVLQGKQTDCLAKDQCGVECCPTSGSCC